MYNRNCPLCKDLIYKLKSGLLRAERFLKKYYIKENNKNHE